MRLSKLISKRNYKCAHCEEDIPAGEICISLNGQLEETQGLSGQLHLSCFIHWLQRVPPKN